MNTIKTTKISADLTWTALRYRFYTLELLNQAIADGTLVAMIQECAATMHDGDTNEVVRILRKNLSSQRTNMNKATVVAIEARDDKKRYELLWNYTGTLAEATKSAKGNAPASTKAKASWQFTDEEIDAIAPDDFNTFKYLYDGMMSKKSKAPDDIMKETTMEEFLNRLAKVSTLKSNAKALKEKQGQISGTLLEKLNAGKSIKLTAEEAAELQKLFNR